MAWHVSSDRSPAFAILSLWISNSPIWNGPFRRPVFRLVRPFQLPEYHEFSVCPAVCIFDHSSVHNCHRSPVCRRICASCALGPANVSAAFPELRWFCSFDRFHRCQRTTVRRYAFRLIYSPTTTCRWTDRTECRATLRAIGRNVTEYTDISVCAKELQIIEILYWNNGLDGIRCTYPLTQLTWTAKVDYFYCRSFRIT